MNGNDPGGWRGLRRVFRLPATTARIPRDLDAEFAFHLDGRIEELVEREGLSRADAEREARRRFGDIDEYRRQARLIDSDMYQRRRNMELMDTLGRELRQAVRTLARTPSFSVIAFATLALGMGATTAIYSVLESVVLRPLPYRHPEELVAILQPVTVPGTGEGKWGMSSGGYFEFRKSNHSFVDMGAYQTSSTVVSGQGDPEEARTAAVTASLFTTLGAHASLGRLILPDDDRPGAPQTVVLSHDYWQRRFGGDRNVVGRTIQTSGGPRQVIGVAEPGLTLPKPGPFASTANLAGFGVDLWEPLYLNPAGPFYNSHQYTGIARLKPGVTPETAQRDLQSITSRFPGLMPQAYSEGFIRQYNFRAGVTSLQQEVLGPVVARSLWILFGAVGLVLLIACANVANLFLVRMEAKRRETAVRTALGADRGHMLVHYLAESLLLTLSAGITGVVIARWAVPALIAAAPRSIPRLGGATVHWTAAAFALGLALVGGLVLGIIPVLRKPVDVETLREGGRGQTTSRRRRTVRSALVIGQVALAVLLLSAAGLLIRSFQQLRNVKPGLDPRGVLTFEVTLPYETYATDDAAMAVHRDIMTQVAALPGVVSVGAADALPLQDYGTGCTVVFREGRPYENDEKTPCVHVQATMPGFFEALHIQVRGRTPTWGDLDGRTLAAVVTKPLADRLWPGEDPIGKGINSNGSSTKLSSYRVVGVVPELRAEGLDQPPSEAVFYPPISNNPEWKATGNAVGAVYVVRTAFGDPMSLLPQVRRIVSSVNAQVPIVHPGTMTEVVDRSMARTSFIMLLLALAAAMALVLSAVGMYGVISYLVTQQRSEIGIRMALGARVSQVGLMVMRQSVTLAVIGVALGIGAAFAGTRLLRSLLFEVSPTDPVVLLSAPVVLIAIAALASFAPARRAAHVDPVETMRN